MYNTHYAKCVPTLVPPFMFQATARLSSELDLALTNATDLAERLAAADAVVAQQQGHIR